MDAPRRVSYSSSEEGLSTKVSLLKARRRELLVESDSACWKDVWALFMEHGPALGRIGAALASQDPRLPADEVTDLLHAFVLERLPRITILTRGMASKEQGRYIRTSFRNFLRTFARSYARHEKSLKQLATEMQGATEGFAQGLENERSVGVFSQGSEDAEEKTLADALPGLRPELAQAAAMFLGLGVSQRSIREIAKELGMTRYATRLAVLDGLLGVAMLLGRRGILGGREVEACRLIILEGRSLADAARALRLTQHQVRSALERARAIVAVAVQKR
jgi:DNA-directed RNA polymerase specialized sigma24 family protein